MTLCLVHAIRQGPFGPRPTALVPGLPSRPGVGVGFGGVSVIGQRSGPAHPRTALRWIGDLAAATDLLSAVRHIGQAAATRILDGYATTVVNDVESQHVRDINLDSQS